ncbi:MAG TPA: ATPase domain-containing protein [Candidatus Methylacidiphilales bacterium]|jgi:KaiC/GvpD/RAD55 family RecA-like ATPase|nr:ATPase domain-containing protein [Candidatus Methylacidiphilales bacterium]
MPATPNTFEYAELVPPVLEVIYDSLALLAEADFEGKELHTVKVYSGLQSIAKSLLKRKWFSRVPQLNKHIIEGIPRRSGKPQTFDTLPRISRLCLLEWEKVQKSNVLDQSTIFVPSPLTILVNILSIPAYTASQAYALAAARQQLFAVFLIHPDSEHIPDKWTRLNLEELVEAVFSFRAHISHRDNIPYKRSLSRASRFLAHYLALRGILRIRFGTINKKSFSRSRAIKDCLAWLRKKDYLDFGCLANEKKPTYEFRLLEKLTDLADAQEIVNEITGIPLAIDGASNVFYGGLRRSESNSLVISLTGEPGTGKTSLSLAVAAALAPYGTVTLYFTTEEGPDRLRSRLTTLIPPFFRNTTLNPKVINSWFYPFQVNSEHGLEMHKFISEYIKPMESELIPKLKLSTENERSIPTIAPLIVIIDGLGGLGHMSRENALNYFCELVERLRKLGCIVFLLSADGIPKESRLEYTVDTVINLQYSDTNAANSKPVRLFQLQKTRLQLSRPGTHVFHLSGEEGVRIAPQLPSQLDAKKTHEIPPPSTEHILNTLFIEKKNKRVSVPTRLVNAYESSRILIYGHGSSGKSALGLKFLMAPVLTQAGSNANKYQNSRNRRRILAISFLYPEKYYTQAKRDLYARARSFYKDISPDLKAFVLTPGYITPEDFIRRIIWELDKAEMEGRPITGVLIDGIHNVFLQFPKLEREDMIWPTIYSLFTRYQVTVVTTFTTFTFTTFGSSPNARAPRVATDNGQTAPDLEFVLRGHRPLLHALVQAADFFFQVEKRNTASPDRRYRLSVNSAYYQPIPNQALVWNAETYEFEESEPLGSGQQMLI